MRLYFLFSLLFCVCNSYSQITKIKIKKADPLYKVSIAGVDSGKASLKKIVMEQQLKVTNEKDGIKIFSYEAYIIDQNTSAAQIFTGKNRTLSDDLLEKLQEGYKQGPITLRFTKVLAYNSFNETIQLNDINVKIVK